MKKRISNLKKSNSINQGNHSKKSSNEKKIPESNQMNYTRRENDITEKNNHNVLGSGLDRLSHSEMRRGIILSEILGKPVSRRRDRRRVGR